MNPVKHISLFRYLNVVWSIAFKFEFKWDVSRKMEQGLIFHREKGATLKIFQFVSRGIFAHLKIEKGGYNNLQTAGRDNYG